MKSMSFLVVGVLLGSSVSFAAEPSKNCNSVQEQIQPFRALIVNKYGIDNLVKAADELISQALATDSTILPLAQRLKAETQRSSEVRELIESYEKKKISEITVQDVMTYQSLREELIKLTRSTGAQILANKMIAVAKKVTNKSAYLFEARESQSYGYEFALTTKLNPTQQISFQRYATSCGMSKVAPDTLTLTWTPYVSVSTYVVKGYEDGRQCQDETLGGLTLLLAGSIDLSGCYQTVLDSMEMIKATLK